MHRLFGRGGLGLVARGCCWLPGGPPQLGRVRMSCVSNSRSGRCQGAPRELGEVPMTIVGGLDIHRKQLTFDYLDTVTGRTRGPGWRGSPAATTSRSRWRGAPAGGTSRRSWPRPASRRTSPSRLTPRSPAAASGTPRPAGPTRGTCGSCWPRAGCRSAGSRRRTSWSAGRCWRPTTTCGPSTQPRRSCAVFFHQGAPALGALRTEQDIEAVQAAAA
jgi:hypothetical protein